MAADWTTAVIAATATMFFQGIAGGVRLVLANRKEGREAGRKLLSVLTMLEWEYDHESRAIDGVRGKAARGIPPDSPDLLLRAELPKTRARLLEFLAAIGEARSVLTEKQIDAALALHLAIEEQVRGIEAGWGSSEGLWPMTTAFLSAMDAKSKYPTRIRAMASKAMIEADHDAAWAAKHALVSEGPEDGTGPASTSREDSQASGAASPQG